MAAGPWWGFFGGILSWEMKNAPAMSRTKTSGRGATQEPTRLARSIASRSDGDWRLNDPLLRIARGLRQGECGDRAMKATLIVIESDSDHAQAKSLVGRLLGSRKPDDRVRMVAQARLIEAYERSRWPRRAPTLPDLLNYLMDQHGTLAQ